MRIGTDESEDVERELEEEIAKEIASNRKLDEAAARLLLAQGQLDEDEIMGAHLRYENINRRSSPKPCQTSPMMSLISPLKGREATDSANAVSPPVNSATDLQSSPVNSECDIDNNTQLFARKRDIKSIDLTGKNSQTNLSTQHQRSSALGK